MLSIFEAAKLLCHKLMTKYTGDFPSPACPPLFAFSFVDCGFFPTQREHGSRRGCVGEGRDDEENEKAAGTHGTIPSPIHRNSRSLPCSRQGGHHLFVSFFTATMRCYCYWILILLALALELVSLQPTSRFLTLTL